MEMQSNGFKIDGDLHRDNELLKVTILDEWKKGKLNYLVILSKHVCGKKWKIL
ncbi:hypothetical protein KM914_19595 [Virgibacillus pantothenticus]|uniref:hypothetical protein n=1 Tax=Virgibacillus TaxID=84406 RepID=UPI0012FEE2C2|nr:MULTISPECIES: hypothetical protein [Virgibacillus]MBS7428009.1 hypothetical protein [Virgibacillus sp. 19R1-5]MBU8568583.1 hypothetical protein [Virgibacillus pantothenticus]MBU8602589.1 hypothetical protein [Virgibacillus pantothenticus]MBU8636709.1 hypothetical protein [Virgibacillus pantothenticus]MBU8644388.1 hypothetical protein [Virgibacillus pantothenticus]